MKKWIVVVLFLIVGGSTLALVAYRRAASQFSAAINPVSVQASPQAETPSPAARAALKELAINEQNRDVLNHLNEYPNLEILSIRCLEDLQALPESIGDLTHLKEFRIDNGNGCIMNAKLPESIGKLTNLRVLVLVGAMVIDPEKDSVSPKYKQPIPKSMANLKQLRELDLSGDELDAIPDFVKSLENLETLKLNFNNFTDLPDYLKDLPKLKTITLGESCQITQYLDKQQELKKRFPAIQFDFNDEYTDCEDLKEQEASKKNSAKDK